MWQDGKMENWTKGKNSKTLDTKDQDITGKQEMPQNGNRNVWVAWNKGWDGKTDQE